MKARKQITYSSVFFINMIKGDHIKVKRSILGISAYYHHGIDLGDGSVIHFTGEPSSGCKVDDAEVRITDMETFLDGGSAEIVKYSRANTPDETIAIAESFFGNKDYSTFSNNCEYFARYCKTFERKSEQVRDAASAAGVGLASVVTSQAAVGAVAASGAVSGVSGAGVMSGLASIGGAVGGGAVAGIVTVAAAPALVSNVAAVSASGSVAGLSAAGITTGLASIGSFVGGGMVAGVALTAAAPAVVALSAGYIVYKWFQKK